MAATDELHQEMLARLPDGAPVVMVNLMKFKERSDDGDGTGWDAYVRYSKLVTPLLKTRGAAIVWAGRGNGGVFGPAEFGEWDYVALVRYPGKDAFIDMIGKLFEIFDELVHQVLRGLAGLEVQPLFGDVGRLDLAVLVPNLRQNEIRVPLS